jgi:glycosyltransferase 2 family protein
LSTPAQGASWKARAAVAARWLGTLGLGAYLLTRSDLGAASAIVAETDPRWIALAIVLYVADRCAGTAKWRLLLSAKGSRISFPTALSIYLQSSFVGAFLPATVGADLVRARMAQPYAGSFASSLSAVIVERLAGVIALVLSAAIGLALFAPVSSWRVAGTPLLWVAAGTVLLIAAALMISRFRRAGAIASGDRLGGRIKRFARELEARLIEYRGHGKVLAVVLSIAFAQQYLLTLITWLLAVALGLEVRLITMLWVWPIVMMAVRLPISVLGFGVREVLLLELIGRAGVSDAGAVTLGLASGLLDILFILLGGGLLLLFPATQPSKQAAESKQTG